MNHQEDEIYPSMKLRLNTVDKLHALQLLRDLEIINERTKRDFVTLPEGGLPVSVKRKPRLPKRAAGQVSESASDSEYQENLYGETLAQYPPGPTSNMEPDMHNPLPSLGIGLMLSLAACDSSPSYVEHKLNPHPRQGYEITMTIADEPGPFASMLGLAQYDVVTQTCLSPPDKNPGGASMHMTRDVEFSLTRVSESQYKGLVYADGVLDEEYYGRGVCHWRLAQARVHLQATGAEGETLFNASISAERLLAEETETTYYWKEEYPRSDIENYPDIGEPSRERFRPELRSNLFEISLSSRKTIR